MLVESHQYMPVAVGAYSLTWVRRMLKSTAEIGFGRVVERMDVRCSEVGSFPTHLKMSMNLLLDRKVAIAESASSGSLLGLEGAGAMSAAGWGGLVVSCSGGRVLGG